MELERRVAKTLEEHPFTREFPLHLRIKLARIARPKAFDAGDYLQRTGKLIQDFHLIVRGSASLEVPRAEGPERLLVLHSGDVAGWSWMVEPYEAAFDVRALEPVEVLAMDGARLRYEFEEDSYLGYAVLKRLLEVVSRRLFSARSRVL